MNLARKLAAGAIAAGLTTAGVLAATPASATVVNSTCNLSSVVNVSYGSGGHYCSPVVAGEVQWPGPGPPAASESGGVDARNCGSSAPSTNRR